MTAEPLANSYSVKAQLIPSNQGKLFSLFYSPGTATRIQPQTAVVFFPPFTEEMNKSRRMVALQARRFCEQGLAVFIVDLYGTGDSEGNFEQATWEIWQQDMRSAVAWLGDQGINQFIFWGLRAGVFLALQTAAAVNVNISKFIMWQPVARGEVMLTQFLRLRMAADLMSSSEKITTKDLRQQLANGNNVEIAGYNLSPLLAKSIDTLQLKTLIPAREIPLLWVEVLPSDSRPVSAVSQQIVDYWRDQGVTVELVKIVGEPFWNTIEIAEVSNLLEVSSQYCA